jgi:uncharacterized protein YutE (UPF0331/DUF86 family)
VISLLRRDLIRTKVKEIEESSKLVKENLPGEFEKFAGLGLVKDGIYKRIEFCIQNALDICSIINSDLKLGIPSSEEDIIENLVRSEILSAELGETLNRMRGFRNILVHRYGRINDEMAFQHKKEGLKDFDRFAEAIEKAMPELERRSQQL